MEAKTKWTIDPSHSEIAFKVKHLMITNVRGTFIEFGGSISITGEDSMTSKVEFSMNPASIDTGDTKRDEHLRSADFFDVENHKKITFVGDSCEKMDKNKDTYTLYGNLTIKGVTKRIDLIVEFGGVMKDPYGNEKAGYSVTGKINRKDWGLNWNTTLEAGGVLVSDEIKISCEVQLVKQKINQPVYA